MALVKPVIGPFSLWYLPRTTLASTLQSHNKSRMAMWYSPDGLVPNKINNPNISTYSGTSKRSHHDLVLTRLRQKLIKHLKIFFFDLEKPKIPRPKCQINYCDNHGGLRRLKLQEVLLLTALVRAKKRMTVKTYISVIKTTI